MTKQEGQLQFQFQFRRQSLGSYGFKEIHERRLIVSCLNLQSTIERVFNHPPLPDILNAP